jgi:hypothetical protein
VTLDVLATLASQRQVGQVTISRDLPYKAFLAHLRQSDSLTNRYIVNFNRAAVFGVSIGHFSPIGGYDPGRDLVTLLDATPG